MTAAAVIQAFIDSLGAVFTGRETLRQGWRGYFALVADYRITVRELVEAPSDNEPLRASLRGTPLGGSAA